MKEVEAVALALRQLAEFLGAIPAVSKSKVIAESVGGAIDLLASVKIGDQPLQLACEVTASGQPRYVRNAILQAQHYVLRHAPDAIPMIIAPYLTEQARQLCREEDVAFLDFEGNARLAAGSIYIEREVASKPKTERRELRSLFKPKSARLLRTLLRDPTHTWRVVELAEAAGVSVGHASEVGSALRAREWAEQTGEGLHLTEPGSLLDAWAQDYEPPAGKQVRLYTPLHGASLDKAARQAMAAGPSGRAALASFSAAAWLAPYGRHSSRYFYADDEGLTRLRDALHLSASDKGGNVIVRVPNEDGVLDDIVQPEPGVVCTSPVQTYLDLLQAGERGQESAEHLRSALLPDTQ